jgi:hypothetical protein
LTFDFTAKIEHLLEYQNLLPELVRLGCVFVVSAIEHIKDSILAILQKGHTRADVEAAWQITRRIGLPLRPSLMPFTPWTTLQDFLELLDFVETHQMIAHIDPVQYSIRLLLPPASSLLALPATEPYVRKFDEEKFTYLWDHPDPVMDRLQREIATCVEAAAHARQNTFQTYAAIRELSYRVAPRGVRTQVVVPPLPELSPPRLTEHWFC